MSDLPTTLRPIRGDALRWCAAVLFLALGVALQQTRWNLVIFQAVNAGVQHWAWAASMLSVLGMGTAVLVVAGVIGLARPQALAAVLITVLSGGLLVHVLKMLVASPRPLAVLGADGVHLVGVAQHTGAMPAGQAALWAAITTLVWLAPRASPLHRRRHLAACWAMTLLAACVALARVAAGAHWPADLLVGAGVGVAVGSLVTGTVSGRGLVRALAAGLGGRAGSRLVGALLVGLATSLWVAERADPAADPVANTCHALLCLLGLVAAWAWWRRHPGPPGRWTALAQRAGRPAR